MASAVQNVAAAAAAPAQMQEDGDGDGAVPSALENLMQQCETAIQQGQTQDALDHLKTIRDSLLQVSQLNLSCGQTAFRF